MAVEFMRMNAASTDIRGPRQIIRPEFDPH
jgi:hypothetical protein